MATDMERPNVTEIKAPRAIVEPDPFIDDLRVDAAQHLAEVIDLNQNVIILADYRQSTA